MIHPVFIRIALWCVDKAATAVEVLWRAWVVALVVMAACGHAALLVEPAAKPTPWCVSIEAEHFGETHETMACADSYELCDFARERAIYFAGLAHFTMVGSCRLEASR